MKSLLLVFAISFLTLFSCGQKDDKSQTSGTSNNEGRQSTTAEQTNKESAVQPSHDPEMGDTDNPESKKRERTNTSDGIRVNFPTGATQVTLNGTIDGFGDKKTYVFEVSKGQMLTASVKPKTSDGNIRISQIINPAGVADGPFDNQITYTLNESGDWKLILSENMMAGDPWKGEYFLTLEIK
jgi:hypothetical protein